MKNKRCTINFDPDLHNALKLKAAVTHQTISEIVGTCLEQSFTEAAEDLAAFEQRAHEPDLDFKNVLKTLNIEAYV